MSEHNYACRPNDPPTRPSTGEVILLITLDPQLEGATTKQYFSRYLDSVIFCVVESYPIPTL